MTRWSLSVLALVSCAPALAPAPASAPARAPAPASVGAAASPLFASTAVQIAPNVYAFVPPDGRTGLVTGNSIAIIGDDGVLVFDTGHFPSLARKQIAELRRITDKPVRYVVNSHWHGDHTGGNAAYREAFPGVVVLAHDETRRLAQKNGPKFLEAERHIDEMLAKFKEALRTGKTSKGRVLTDTDRRYFMDTIEAAEATKPDLLEGKFDPATATFADHVVVRLGSREVRVMHLGRGNTAGDVVVFVPDAKTLLTGDLVVAPIPYAFGVYFDEWIATLGKLRALEATTIVPGHGPVMHDYAYVDTLTALFGSVRTQVAELVKSGVADDQIAAKVDIAKWRRELAGDDGTKQFWFDKAFLEPGVARAIQEAKGKLEDE
jgi:glyoxylase-like metal-dependent hydrolase (beta-lactamase superfamily II)